MQEYINNLQSMTFRDMHFELSYLKKWKLQELCHALSLPIRYDDKSLKPKDILVAAVYEELRVQREQVAA